MLEKIFGSNNTLALYVIPFLVLLLALFAWFSGANQLSDGLSTYHLSKLISNWQWPAGLQVFVMAIIHTVGAWVITTMASGYDMHEKPNHWPGLLYVLLNTMHPSLWLWNGFAPANLLLLLAMRRMLQINQLNKVGANVFDAGLYLGLAGFFQPGYWFILIVAFIILGVMRPFKWREYAILLIGYLVPFYFYTLILVWIGKLTLLNQLFSGEINSLSFYNLQAKIIVVSLVFYTSCSWLLTLSSMRYSTIIERKQKRVLIYLSAVVLMVSFGLGGKKVVQLFSWHSIPLALLVPFFIQWLKRTWLQNLLILTLLAILVLNYLYFPIISH